MNAPVHSTALTTASGAAVPLRAGGTVQAFIPTTYDEAWRMSKGIVEGGFNPPSLKSAQAVMQAIIYGLEVGMKPFMALKNIAIINGRPAVYGDAIPGLVYASGLCEFIELTYEGEGDNLTAICTTKRKGAPHAVSDKFSVADAKKAGVWGKAGPWSAYPRRMLGVRARSFVLRDTYADILGGINVFEEVEDSSDDLIDVTPPPATPPPADEPTPAIARRRGPRAAKAVQPEAEEEAPPAEVVTVDGEVIEVSPPPAEEAEFVEAEPEMVDPDELLSALRLAFAAAESKDEVGEAWDTYAREIAGALPEVKARASGLYKARLEELSGETEEQRKERLRPAYDAGVLAFFRGRKASLGVEKPWRDDEELSKTYMKGYRKAEKGEVANPDIPPPADDFPGDAPPIQRTPTPTASVIDAAYELGRQARIKGMSQRAIPGELRSDDRAAEAEAWRDGWNDAASAAP
jgi:hypothetical protein